MAANKPAAKTMGAGTSLAFAAASGAGPRQTRRRRPKHVTVASAPVMASRDGRNTATIADGLSAASMR